MKLCNLCHTRACYSSQRQSCTQTSEQQSVPSEDGSGFFSSVSVGFSPDLLKAAISPTGISGLSLAMVVVEDQLKQ